MISLLSKRCVQIELPTLLPVRSAINQSLLTFGADLLPVIRLAECDQLCVFEALKKLCKKYRYMFRSDNLFTEMNYVIKNLSPHLLPAGDQLYRGVQGTDHEH
jgi:hypothetical protein